MSVFDALQRTDAERYYYLRIQGIAEDLVDSRAGTRSYTGRTVKPVIAPQVIAPTYGQITLFEGLGTTGHLELQLVDYGGYLESLVDDGIETWLAADVEEDDTTIEVADASSLPASGSVYIHREKITYTGISTNTLTGCTRGVDDDYYYTVPHRIPTTLSGTQARVRVGTAPLILEGRWVSLRLILLDGAGEPVTIGGESDWELWRGTITDWPVSPDLVAYSMAAETIDRSIMSTPPSTGFNGRLITGAAMSVSGSKVAWYQAPLYIPSDRAKLPYRMSTQSYSLGVGISTSVIERIVQLPTGWTSLTAILQAIAADLTATGEPVTFQIGTTFGADLDNGESTSQVVKFIYSSAYDDAAIRVITLDWSPGPALAQQLGLGDTTWFWTDWGGGDGGGDEVKCGQPFAQLYITKYDSEIPVFIGDDQYTPSGFVMLGDEALYYGSIEDGGEYEGVQVAVLTDCRRGLGGTVAQEWEYRYGSEDGELPGIAPTYVLGSTTATPESIWPALTRCLTGTGDVDCSGNGTYSEEPGLGISTAHIDVAALTRLAGETPLIGMVDGVVEDCRAALSSVLALEGYALIARLTESGCLLTPVRVGTVSADEEADVISFGAKARINVSGGLGDIVNIVKVSNQQDHAATLRDIDSAALYGVQQSLTMELQTASPDSLQGAELGAFRLMILGSKKNIYRAKITLGPGNRDIQAGDAVQITFPNTKLNGYYRVFDARHTLRGRGQSTILAARFGASRANLYAPTATVADYLGLAVTVGTGEGQWFSGVGAVRLFSESDHAAGADYTVASVVGDVITLASGSLDDSIVGMSVEPADETDMRYLYLRDGSGIWSD